MVLTELNGLRGFLSNMDIQNYIKNRIIEVEPAINDSDYRPYGIRVRLADIIAEFKQSDEPYDMRHYINNEDFHKNYGVLHT